jgi:hypothetical protein
VAAWTVRAALAIGWWAPVVALGAAGGAVMGVLKLGAWVWGLPRQGRRRARIRARQAAKVRAAQRKAQAEFIDRLERMWEQ